jgi:hypothetical protein
MAKGQRRSNREVKKPKQPKSERSGVVSLALAPAAPAARERVPVSGRDRSGPRNGRR